MFFDFRHRLLSPQDAAPEAAYHRAWVRTTLSEALIRVREICSRRKQTSHLAIFEEYYLRSGDSDASWDDIGQPHKLTGKEARERAQTVARHFRYVLRRMLRQQVSGSGARATEAAIDEEIEALLRNWR